MGSLTTESIIAVRACPMIRITFFRGREVTIGTTLCRPTMRATVYETTPKGECGKAPEPLIIDVDVP